MGNILIFLTSLFTIGLFILSKYAFPSDFGWITLSQFSGIAGLFYLCWAFLLSIRHKKIEELFSGLDKVYKTHHAIGGAAYIFLVYHPMFLILNRWPQNTIMLYLFPSETLSYNLGILAFYLLTFLLILTIFINLPYKMWKWTHEWMGLVVLLGGLHSMLIISDISRYTPLRYWMFFCILVALCSYIYKRFIYYLLQKPNNYQIVVTKTQKGILYLSLTPTDPSKKIYFYPGQFAFLSFYPVRDEHPFTVLSQEGDKVNFAIKMYGQFTDELSKKDIDTKITVRGPFGMFGSSLSAAPQVWIAGGIGITPFVSMLDLLLPDQKATLIWSCRDDALLHLGKKFKEFEAKNHNFEYRYIDTSSDRHVSLDLLQEWNLVGKKFRYLLCGPISMMTEIGKQLSTTGIKKKKINYEDFSLK